MSDGSLSDVMIKCIMLGIFFELSIKETLNSSDYSLLQKKLPQVLGAYNNNNQFINLSPLILGMGRC